QRGRPSGSSCRFERGVGQVSGPIAWRRAAELIVELCGGEMHPIECGLSAKPFKTVAVVITRKGNEETRRVLPTSGQSYFRAHAMGRPVVHVRPERVRQLLGVEVTEDRIGQILRGFGLESFETPATPSLAPTPAGVELDAKMRAAVEAGQANMEEMIASI